MFSQTMSRIGCASENLPGCQGLQTGAAPSWHVLETLALNNTKAYYVVRLGWRSSSCNVNTTGSWANLLLSLSLCVNTPLSLPPEQLGVMENNFQVVIQRQRPTEGPSDSSGGGTKSTKTRLIVGPLKRSQVIEFDDLESLQSAALLGCTKGDVRYSTAAVGALQYSINHVCMHARILQCLWQTFCLNEWRSDLRSFYSSSGVVLVVVLWCGVTC